MSGCLLALDCKVAPSSPPSGVAGQDKPKKSLADALPPIFSFATLDPPFKSGQKGRIWVIDGKAYVTLVDAGNWLKNLSPTTVENNLKPAKVYETQLLTPGKLWRGDVRKVMLLEDLPRVMKNLKGEKRWTEASIEAAMSQFTEGYQVKCTGIMQEPDVIMPNLCYVPYKAQAALSPSVVVEEEDKKSSKSKKRNRVDPSVADILAAIETEQRPVIIARLEAEERAKLIDQYTQAASRIKTKMLKMIEEELGK